MQCMQKVLIEHALMQLLLHIKRGRMGANVSNVKVFKVEKKKEFFAKREGGFPLDKTLFAWQLMAENLARGKWGKTST